MSSNNDECELTPYSEMVDIITNLAFLVREQRRARRMSMRASAVEMGVNGSTVHRLEHGNEISVSNLISVLQWLDWQHTHLQSPIPDPEAPDE